jgi:hypothetical protein
MPLSGAGVARLILFALLIGGYQRVGVRHCRRCDQGGADTEWQFRNFQDDEG